MPVSAGGDERADAELASEFHAYWLWGMFHLDCLMSAMRLDLAVQPDVLIEIGDGLRSFVNAYGIVRAGHEIRLPRPEDPQLIAYTPEEDEEDRELLAMSMRDMLHETVG